MPLNPTITDHRGHPRPLCRPDDLGPGTPRPIQRACAYAHFLTSGNVALLALQSLAYPALMLEAIHWWRTRTFALGAWLAYLWPTMIGGVAAIVACFLFVGRSLGRHYTHETLRACLAQPLCPSCAYSLAGLPPDPDGATPCPECGAAWRLPTPRPNALEAGIRPKYPAPTLATRDDRGRWIKIVPLGLIPRRPRRPDARHDQRLALVRGLRHGSRRPRRPLACAALGASVFLAGLALLDLLAYGARFADALNFIIGAGGFLFLALLIDTSDLGLWFGHGKRALLKAALCPACTADLSKTPPDPDGRTVCPECSAAWRLPTPQTPAPAQQSRQ